MKRRSILDLPACAALAVLLSVACPAASRAATWSTSFPSLSSFLDSAMATEVFPDGSLAALVKDAEGRVVGQGLSEGFFTLRP